MSDSQANNENADDQQPENDVQQSETGYDRPSDDESNEAPGESISPDSADEDELPEEEELTPEYVEEEAIRGDFMLRWAVVFLAVLFGFSQIADTRTLVHIRSGDAMRANGVLPAGQDALSYATEGSSVSNVSWLFDHVVSAVYMAGGDKGLTFFKALLAGLVAYLLSLISVRGMPTWWSSVCCAFAVTACSIDFLPLTDLVTLLGLTTTLLWLHRYDEDGNGGSLTWKLPLLTIVWANMDPRAYLGILAVLLFAVGAKLRKAQSAKAGDVPGVDISRLWKGAGLSVIALLLNPFPVASLLSVATTYTTEYPGMAMMRPITNNNGQPMDAASMLDGRTEYWQLWIPEVFNGFELAYIAGLFLLLIAFAVLGIGRDRTNMPWAVMLIGFALLAAVALHELPAASLVAAATAGIAAQRWYGRAFRQEYSIDTAEVLFSRGGRAITVLALAALAFFIVADRLPTRTAVGLGFDPDLSETITSLGDELSDIPETDRILNTRMTQGDLLIWHGRQSFIDSRVVPFGRANDKTSLLSRFDSLRKSLLLSKAPEATDPGSLVSEGIEEADPAENYNWPEEFAAFGLSNVMIRLAPPGPPAYALVEAFSRSPGWTLAGRGASSAIFKYTPDGPQSAAKSEFDIRRLAFQTQEKKVPVVARIDFGREPDFYSKYVYAKRSNTTVALRQAQHFYSLNSRFDQQRVINRAAAVYSDPDNLELVRSLGSALGGSLLTIRNANTVLYTDPQNVRAYRLLGMAYQQLGATESNIAAVGGGHGLDRFRALQSIMAFRQATRIDPKDADSWFMLVGLYRGRNQLDLARECLEKYLELSSDEIFDSGPEGEDRLRELSDMRLAWTDQYDAVFSNVDAALDSDELPKDPQEYAQQVYAMAEQLFGRGHARIALHVINENIELLRAMPPAEVLHGSILMEAGELEEADEILNRLASYLSDGAPQPELARLNWHTPVALIRLAKADYETAKAAWADKLAMFRDANRNVGQVLGLMAQVLPLAVTARPTAGVAHWPLSILQSGQLPLGAMQKGAAEPAFFMAMADIEAGRVNDARRALEKIVSESGETPYRPLATVYLQQLSDDAQELVRDSALNRWEEFQLSIPAESTSDEHSADVHDNTEVTDASGKSPEPGADAASGSDATDGNDDAKPDAATDTEKQPE